jgi:hypothetical protein
MPKNKPRTPAPAVDMPSDVLTARNLTDAITLRLGRLVSLALMVSEVAAKAQINGSDGDTMLEGVEVLADTLVAELNAISEQVSELHGAVSVPAGGAR